MGSLSRDPRGWSHVPAGGAHWFLLPSLGQEHSRQQLGAARSVPINTFKMGVLLEMGRLTREEEEMGVRKRKQTEETPRLGIMDAA